LLDAAANRQACANSSDQPHAFTFAEWHSLYHGHGT
jgi:hypothetical protein